MFGCSDVSKLRNTDIEVEALMGRSDTGGSGYLLQILQVIYFAVCFRDVAKKNQNIYAIDVFLTCNCVMRELHLLQITRK